MVEEFKKFILRGNVFDMACGIIIGASFSNIVTSLLQNIIWPPLGLLIGNIDFSQLEIVLRSSSETNAAVAIKYGLFIDSLINFLIVSLSIFLTVHKLSKLKRKEHIPITTKTCSFCCNLIPLEAKKCGFCTTNIS